VLNRDEVPGLQMGLVELTGPIHKSPATHDHFHQAYLIQSGRGVIRLGEESYQIDGPTLVVIPRGTHHSVELQAGEQLRYIFVNQYLG
jgi:mannose-6-phosphate isomerase-like protein (cupin superfamily)